jgi:uncharacterized protein YceK
MRKIIVISCILVVIVLSGCGSGNSKTAPGNNSAGTSEISFREYEHDFGKVAEGEKLSYIFVFDNKGTSDLIVSSASTTCGCTVPKYDAKPISPGADGKIEVVFDTSGRSGKQTKTITVKSNASKPVVLLKITAEVMTNDK